MESSAVEKAEEERRARSKFWNEELVKCRLREAAVMTMGHVGAGALSERKDRFSHLASLIFDEVVASLPESVRHR